MDDTTAASRSNLAPRIYNGEFRRFARSPDSALGFYQRPVFFKSERSAINEACSKLEAEDLRDRFCSCLAAGLIPKGVSTWTIRFNGPDRHRRTGGWPYIGPSAEAVRLCVLQLLPPLFFFRSGLLVLLTSMTNKHIRRREYLF